MKRNQNCFMKTNGIIDFEEEEKQKTEVESIELKIDVSLLAKGESPVWKNKIFIKNSVFYRE